MKFYIYFTLALIVLLVAWFFWWTTTLTPQEGLNDETKTSYNHTLDTPSLALNENL